MKKSKKSKAKSDSKQKSISNNHISCSFGYRIDENAHQAKLECIGILFDGRSWNYASTGQ